MNQEPTHKEISDDDGTPATKGDVRAAQEELAQAAAKSFAAVDRRFDSLEGRMGGLEGRMDGLESRMDRLESGQKAILNVVQSIDERLKAWADTPERVAKLEDEVAEFSLRR